MAAKIDKKDLKGPDAFHSFSDRAFSWVEKNAKAIGGFVTVVLVASAAYIAYGWYSASQEAKAAEALFKPESAIEKAETALREERAKLMQDKKIEKPESARPVDFAKDFGPAVVQVKAALKDNASSRAALVSALNLTSFLIEKKQFAEALEVIEIPRYRPGNSDMLNGFYQMHRGVVYLENKKFDEALRAYQDILGSKGLKYFHPEALLKIGVAYEMKGDQSKARETYEKLSKDFPDSESSKSAQQYMRLLEMKPQQG